MRSRQWWLAAGLSAAISTQVWQARADAPCAAVTRNNLVPCVLGASLDRRALLESVAAASARVTAEDPWFPSSPTVALTGSRREGSEGTTFNWSASLGVELQIAGQRAARRRAAVAERQAEQKNVEAFERVRAAEAWRAYFEVLAAREERTRIEQLEQVARRVAVAARATAERGLASGVEADLAEAVHIRAAQRRILAVRDEQVARGELALLLGLDDAQIMTVEGKLEPLPVPAADRLVRKELPPRPETVALKAQSEAFASRASAHRRSRVPNPTLSVFAENDAFDEHVIGVGLAFPLPLPEPIGRMHSGEIAENEALARRAALLADRSRRAERASLLRAVDEYRAAGEGAAMYSEELLARTEKTVQSLADELTAGRLAIREAVIAQEPLVELLLGAVEARRRLCLASVELVRAAGVPFASEMTR